MNPGNRSRSKEPLLSAKPSKFSNKQISSFAGSLAIHVVFLFVLSWFYFTFPGQKVVESFLLLMGANSELPGDGTEINFPESKEETIDLGVGSMEAIIPEDDLAPMLAETKQAVTISSLDFSRTGTGSALSPKATTAKSTNTSKSAPASTGKSDTKKKGGAEIAVLHTDHFEGRSSKNRAALLKRMGGTDASEAAVARGLVWLQNHQLPDGSWNFYHLHNPRCDCTMPGRLGNNPNAATAMALLAFLGAGQTNNAGDYQPEVQKGLDYLLANGMRAEKGISFYGDLSGPPTYYTHGLVTISLSEAYAMTNDARLRPAITGAIDYLAATQDDGGGWRYYPGQPGDTSVVAWQLMAIKSAQFSRIMVPQKVITGVDRFMHSVSSMRGSQYAYTPNRKENPTISMTAAGLLCRMYLDWKDNGGLQAGVRILDEHGPEPEDMYYNYYATQVMHHWGGPEWDRWNKVMREHLINTQIRDGHANGSWDVADRHGMMGGRVYMTTLALLTLEVYYRHLPLYQKDRIELPMMSQPADVKNP